MEDGNGIGWDGMLLDQQIKNKTDVQHVVLWMALLVSLFTPSLVTQ